MNDIYNLIGVWRNEGKEHSRALIIIQKAIDQEMLKPYLMKVLQFDTPFSRSRIDEIFSSLESEFKPKKELIKHKKEDFPKDLHAEFERRQILYREIDLFRAELENIHYTRSGTPRKTPNIKRAGQIALDLLSHQSEIDLIHHKLDYYHHHKTHLPGTQPKEPMTDLQKAADLLQNQVEAINYVRKENSHKKKTGAFRNPEEYRRRMETIKEINEFIDKHGR